MSTKKLSPLKNSLLSHHAFRVQCSNEEQFAQMVRHVGHELHEAGYTVDTWSRVYESLGVGDKAKGERYVEEICDRARDSVARASGSVGAVRLVALFFARINREAQNALLKTLEEPPETTKIILATPTPEALLPTIISRTVVLQREKSFAVPESAPQSTSTQNKVTTRGVHARELLLLSKAQRLEAIKDIIEDKKIAEARALILGLVDEAHMLQVRPATKNGLTNKERIDIEKKLLALDRELEGGAPMLKMVLEAAVLLVP